MSLTKPNLRDFGVRPNTINDCYDGTMKFIQAVTEGTAKNNPYVRARVQYESGRYEYSEGIVLRKGAPDQPITGFSSLDIRGDGNSFDPAGIGGGTQIILHDKQGAMFYVQKGKGNTISHLNVQGANELWRYSMADVVDEKSDFNPSGCLDTRRAMHAAILIDADLSKFPKKAARGYINDFTGISGSTGIRVSEFAASGLILGIGISTGGGQNGEDCKFTNIWLQNMKVAMSSGDIQNRTNKVLNFTSWGNVKTCFDTVSYGNGCPFVIDGFNLAGATYQMFNTAGWAGNDEYAANGHAEELYRIGGNHTDRGNKITLTNCKMYFMGSSTINKIPSQLVQTRKFVAKDCQFWFGYGKQKSIQSLSVFKAVFDNCEIDCPIMGAQPAEIVYRDVNIGRQNEVNASSLIHVTSIAGVVSAIDKASNTWKFTGDTSKVVAGQFVSIWRSDLKSEFSWGDPMAQGSGEVGSVSGNEATVKDIAYGVQTIGQNLDIALHKA